MVAVSVETSLLLLIVVSSVFWSCVKYVVFSLLVEVERRLAVDPPLFELELDSETSELLVVTVPVITSVIPADFVVPDVFDKYVTDTAPVFTFVDKLFDDNC